MQVGEQNGQDMGTTRQEQNLEPSLDDHYLRTSQPELEIDDAAAHSLEQPISEPSEDDLSIEMGSFLEDDPSLAASLEVDANDTTNGHDSSAVSTYGTSIYPRIQPAYQVEHPFENRPDSATMCVPLPEPSARL